IAGGPKAVRGTGRREKKLRRTCSVFGKMVAMNTPPQPGDLPTSKCGDNDAADDPRTKTEPSSSTEVTGSLPACPVQGVATEAKEFPERFGRYVLVKKLGRGGMGTV